MIEIEFSEKDIEELHYERYHYPHPRVQQKMEAVYLKSQEIEHKEIRRLCRISEPTLCSYLTDYKEGGIEKLKEVKFYQPKSELEEYKDTIENYFRKNPPTTIKEAQAKIEELTGIKRSEPQVRKFLKNLGLKLLKVGCVPGKATSPEKVKEQEEFKEQKLQPRLEEAKKGKRTVFFVDAAHFVYGTFLGYLWCFVRVFILSPSGRKRYNVLGALDAITKKIIAVTNETYINSESVCQLLFEISLLNIKTPITIVLDNAKYQRCQLVQDYASALGMELLYLPSYSPNLNLIERFWKFVKKECLYSKYYSDFKSFQNSIYQCVFNANTKYKKELHSLLTLNFQSFKKVKIMPS